MQIALIGWQGGGKSTLFKALTGTEPSIGEQANLGVASVPDERLDNLHVLYPPAKKIPARVDYIDLAGLAHTDERSGFKRSMINHLQGSNLLAAVFGVFHLGDESPDNIADYVATEVADIEAELLLSDLQAAENRLERIEHSKNRGQKVNPAEVAILDKVMEALNEETPLREIDLDEKQEKLIRSFAFLTQKPLLLVINISDEQDGDQIARILEEKLSGVSKQVEVVNAMIEAEIASLDESDRDDFLADMGIEHPASERVIRVGFDLLNLVSFFTVGDDEVRAWPVKKGTEAVSAAGEIHTDLERGFIRAEVVQSSDLAKLGSLSACKDKGILRLEGKTYIVEDGVVMHVRFAV